MDPEVRLVEPFADIDAEAGSEPARIALLDHFQGNGAAESLSFTVDTVSAGVAEGDVQGTDLVVSYLAPGSSDVVVSARGGGAVATDTFTVRVSSPGPSGPAAGEADFLPVRSGAVWTYEYSYDDWCSSSSYTTERKGRVTFAFGSSVEGAGIRTIDGEITADLSERRTNTYTYEVDSTDVS